MKRLILPSFGRLARRAGAVFSALGLTVAAASAHAEVVTEDLVNPDDETDVWGQKITGLGADGSETAIVFTKTGETMDWIFPEGVKCYSFLVVGGGGGGGGFTAGGGGGGGGVVTGIVNSVEKDVALSVTVGGGGAGGAANGAKGANGSNSQIVVGENPLVVAYGGGGGAGKGFNSGPFGSSGGGNGGTTLTAKSADKGYFDETKVTAFAFGNKGGNSKKDNPTASAWSGAGGGGATEAGVDVTAEGLPADGKGAGTKGGEGLTCDITGVSGVYGSGGGGGASNAYGHRGLGGTNAGNGVQNKNTDSRDGVANFGGGGGGGGANDSVAKGGAGGSGIVVIRFRVLAADEALVPTIAGKTYNGEPQTADVTDDEGYTVTANEGGVNAGEYIVTLTLRGGYHWVGGSTDPTNLTFTIAKAANSWTTAPSLTKTAWEKDAEPAGLNLGEAVSGTVVVTFDDGLEEMPLSVGGHTAVFTVAESQNYLELSKSITYTINKNTNSWIVKPEFDKTTWAFNDEPGALTMGVAKYGAETMTIAYDDGEGSGLTNSVGSHTVKFTVDAGTDYAGITETLTYNVTKIVNGWVTPPVVPSSYNIEDPVPEFTAPTSMYGEVRRYFDNDVSALEPPTALGKHSVTYVVDEGENFQAYEQTIGFEVVYKPIFDYDDPARTVGYRLPQLGDNHDEVALVFTNTASAAAYRLPQSVSQISYLVVGGGGGGGGGTQGAANGRGGGGGGGVLTDTITVPAHDLEISVGQGGLGTAADSKVKDSRGAQGGHSMLKFGDMELVAYGGGGGSDGAVSGLGGDTVGCGGGGGKNTSGGVVTAGQGCNGGSGAGGNYLGGGGGGAGTAGHSSVSKSVADGGDPGHGGDGIPSSITGIENWYAGGGGASHANNVEPKTAALGGHGGGGNGGYGASNQNAAGGDATYFGGGGGGAHKTTRGGNGYQGVVIIRYTEDADVVMVPRIASKTYTGGTLTADVPADVGYTVTQNDGGTDVGEYDVILTLKEGCHWDGGSTEPTNLVFAITPAQNAWVDGTPALSGTIWYEGEPETLTPGATTFGTPTAKIVKNSETNDFAGLAELTPGNYELVYAVERSDNWIDPEDLVRTLAFTVVGAQDVPPFTVTMGEVTTVEGASQVDLSVGYTVASEVPSEKTVTLYALIFEDGSAETNRVTLAEGVEMDAEATGTIENLTPGTGYWVAIYGAGGATVSPTTPFRKVTVKGPATDLRAEATFTNNPKEYIISGSVTPGLGTTTVTVYYGLNTKEYTPVQPTLNADGSFEVRVQYTGFYDVLNWYVAVENTYGERTWNSETEKKFTRREDTQEVTYTWTGNAGDGLWHNPENWSPSVPAEDCMGIPDSQLAKVQFLEDAIVDFSGGTVDIKGDEMVNKVHYPGLIIKEGITVVFKNGGMIAPSVEGGCLGATGATLIFRDFMLARARDLVSNPDRVNPAAGCSIVFEGDTLVSAVLRPWSVSDWSVSFCDGDVIVTNRPKQIIDGVSGGNYVISNATVRGYTGSWSATASAPWTLIDGPDRQAQLSIDYVDDGLNRCGFTFIPQFTFVLGSDINLDQPYLEFSRQRTNEQTQAINFTVDATKWRRRLPVPLVRFTSETNDIVRAAFGELVSNAKLKVIDRTKPTDRQDVTIGRNAKLVWKGEENTLYYEQRSVNGYSVILR